VVRLAKENFVCVAVNCHTMRDYKDAEVDWARSTDCVPDGATANGSVRFVTASGKQLARGELVVWDGKSKQTNWFLVSVERAIKAWAALPDSERKPGSVKVPEYPPVDPKRAVAVKPPDGSLVLRVYNRQLARDTKGELRYTVADDYVPELKKLYGQKSYEGRFSEVGQDWMWITRQEWQAMMPEKPVKGQEVKVPTTLVERVFRFHLEPSRGFTAVNQFIYCTADDGQMRLTVEEAGANEVRLRLDGFAKLELDRGAGYEGVRRKIGYQPSLLGYLAYDPAKKVFTRFDLVALGNARGQANGENLMGARTGEFPMGVAFELVNPLTPRDYVQPTGLMDGGGNYNLDYYLCQGRFAGNWRGK
jgi:hypothetical protein